MDAFSNPRFRQIIPGIARAYGSLPFWLENLNPECSPDGIWRGLLLCGCLGLHQFASRYRVFLDFPDSRVRAWACFALGCVKDEASLEQVYALNADPSNRVRIHAWQAVQAIVGPEQSARNFPIRIPPSQTLILISEDSTRMQQALTTLFSGMGFRTEVASTQQETLRKALELRPQAIITDNQKLSRNPTRSDDLSGLNLVFDLSRHADLRETVLFMLTNDSVEPIFLWNGGDYFLSKQRHALGELAQVVNEYLHH